MDGQSNSSSSLGDESTGLESVVDTLNRVILHGDEETRGELRTGSTSVEEGRRSMGEESLGHEVVGLDSSLNVISMNSNGDSHDEMLRPFSN